MPRADDAAKGVFQERLQSIAASVVDGPDSPAKPATHSGALTALASLIGAVTMARAMDDDLMAQMVATAMRQQLLGAAA